MPSLCHRVSDLARRLIFLKPGLEPLPVITQVVVLQADVDTCGKRKTLTVGV